MNDPVVGYAFFHHRREELIAEGYSHDDAFVKARQECIEKGYLKGFIEREEFVDLYRSIMDYDAGKLVAEGERRGEAKGRAEGRAEGAEDSIRAAIEENAPMSLLERMAAKVGISSERLQELIDEVRAVSVG